MGILVIHIKQLVVGAIPEQVVEKGITRHADIVGIPQIHIKGSVVQLQQREHAAITCRGHIGINEHLQIKLILCQIQGIVQRQHGRTIGRQSAFIILCDTCRIDQSRRQVQPARIIQVQGAVHDVIHPGCLETAGIDCARAYLHNHGFRAARVQQAQRTARTDK